MTKKTTSITIDYDVWKQASDMNLNISAICNEALKNEMNYSAEGKEIEHIKNEAREKLKLAEELERKATEVKKKRDLALDEFRSTVPARRFLENPVAGKYWSNKTGLTEDELILIKKKEIGIR